MCRGKTALRRARTAASPRADAIRNALDDAHRAFSAGCWLSSTADDFGVALADRRSSLRTVHDNAMGEFDDAIAGQPEAVESTDHRATWHTTRIR